MTKWVVDRIGKVQVWYSEDVIERIKEIAKTGLKPICYKANCSTCRCYTKDDKNYSLNCLINSYINEDGELMDGNCDFGEALEALVDSERVACNKAKPIAEEILKLIESEDKNDI